MLSFALAVLFLIITPGPGVLSVAGVGSGYGAGPGSRYIAGLWVGTNLVALVVVSGMATILLANAQIRTMLLLASIGYLVFLALKIAFAGARIAFGETARSPGFWDGIALQAVNPKAYAVNTTLFTGFAFLPDNLGGETLIKFLIMNVIWLPIHFAWLFLGISLHRLNLAPRAQRRINIAMALSMLCVVALALLAPK